MSGKTNKFMVKILNIRFSSILAVNAGLVVFNFAFMGLPVMAGGFAVYQTPTDFDTLAKIFGLISGIVTVLVFLIGLVWFIWRGKNLEQLQRSNAEWKDLAESRAQRIAEKSARIAELEAENIRKDAEYKRMREIQDELLVENLRLGGKKKKELR